MLPKCRSHYLSHMMPNLGGVFFLLPDKVIVVHNLTRWMWEKMSAHFDCSMKEGKSSKLTSCGPSNFEGDRPRPIAQKPPNCWE